MDCRVQSTPRWGNIQASQAYALSSPDEGNFLTTRCKYMVWYSLDNISSTIQDGRDAIFFPEFSGIPDFHKSKLSMKNL